MAGKGGKEAERKLPEPSNLALPEGYQIEIVESEGCVMTRAERENWIISIECCADRITEEIGYETVAFVLGKYGANSIQNLLPEHYGDVFSELYAIEADLK